MESFVNIDTMFLVKSPTVGNGCAPRKLNKTEKEMQARKHKHYHYIAVFIQELEE